MSTPRYTAAHVLEAVVLDVTLATSDVIDTRGFTHLFVYPDSSGSIKWSVVVDDAATVHGPNPVTGSTDEIQEIVVAGNFYLIEAITSDCHAHPVFLNQGGSDLSVEDEGIEKLAAATILDFKGAGVVVADDGGGQAGITIAGGGAVSVEDEGTELTADVNVMDFVGAGVTVTEPTADEVQVTIPATSIGPIKDFDKGKRTAGNLVLNNTSWTNLDTGLDLVLQANVGDEVTVGLSGRWLNESLECYLDVVSLVSSSPVNAWSKDGAESGTGAGVGAWGAGATTATHASYVGGTISKTIVAGDLENGNVTLRFRFRTASASNRTLNGTSDIPLDVWAINFGQTFGDPNPPIGPIKDFQFDRRTAGDLTLNAAIWTNVDTGLDLILDAAVGDIVQVGMSGFLEAGSSSFITGFDFVSIVSASPVNAWGQDGTENNSNQGIAALTVPGNTDQGKGGSVARAVVSGDLSTGTLTLRLRYNMSTGVNRDLRASAAFPLHVWAINYGQTFGDRIGKIALDKRTGGDLTLNSTTWANLDTVLDLVLDAVIGDLVEVGMSGLHGAESPTSYIDVVSLVSSSPVNSWSRDGAEAAAHNGLMAWRGQGSEQHTAGGQIIREIVSGDLSSGTVTLRFRYKTSTASNKTMFATVDNPLHVWAKNHGPVGV